MPTVSVIMPAYNVAHFICQSIGSVVAQSFTDWELIIVDDCSTDNTVEKVKNFLKDERVVLIENSLNLGGAKTRNVAIERAQGRFIAFLDSDDIWLSDKLETQVEFMVRHGYAFTFSDYYLIDESGLRNGVVKTPRKIDFKAMLRSNYIGCLTAMYDVKQLGKVYMPEIRKRQDFALWLKILKKTKFATSISEPLAEYRVRASSLSSNKLDALRYYWRVLIEEGGQSRFKAYLYTTNYFFLVSLKKVFPSVYNFITSFIYR